MKKLSTLFVTLVVAGACFAPLLDKPSGSAFHGELSEAEMTKLQGGSTSVGAVSEVQRTNDTIPSQSSMNGPSEDAAKTISTSSANISNSSQAAQSLQTSQDDIKNEAKTGPNIVIGIVFVFIGVGVFYGVRSYLDKVAADPFENKSKSKPKF